MPTTSILLALAVIVVAVLIYRPILKIANADMAARSRSGRSNGVVYAILLFPLVGPLCYLLIRKSLLPKA